MELEHSFSIPVPVEKAWPILLDIRRIAPCMPGAGVDSVDGDDFTGSVKVKLGPINLTYKGQAKFVEKDEAAHRAVIDARGRDSRGNGTASAKITAQLDGQGESTTVKVVTDLNITGKPAQFGRGVMVDVGNKLIGQFADCLATKLGDDGSDADTPTTAAGNADATPTGSIPAATSAEADADKAKAAAEKSAPKPAPAPAAEAEPIDLIELAGGSVAKQAVPIAAGVGVFALLLVLLRGRKKRKKAKKIAKAARKAAKKVSA